MYAADVIVLRDPKNRELSRLLCLVPEKVEPSVTGTEVARIPQNTLVVAVMHATGLYFH